MAILELTISRGHYWDLAGIGASTLCVTHCLATPLLVVFLPVLELVESLTHSAFALTILLIGLGAFWPGYRRHRHLEIVATALAGFGLISFGVIVPEGLLSESAEATLTVMGGIMLITAHLRNTYFCRACQVCGEQECLKSQEAVRE